MTARLPLLPLLICLLSCATLSLQPAETAAFERAEAGGAPEETGGWVPAAGAKGALDSLWASAPFKLPSATLALASGGPVAPARLIESMLYESVVQIEPSGRSTENEHLVYRVLNSNPDQTLTFSWSPWRAERPVIRARVVSPEGVESLLDASTIVETNATLDGLQLTDVRQLQVALPNVRRGSVIEYTVLTTSPARCSTAEA